MYSTERMTLREEETIDSMVENLTAKAMSNCKYRPKMQNMCPIDNDVLLAIHNSYGSIYENVIEESKCLWIHSMIYRALRTLFPESITINLPDVKVPVEYYVSKTYTSSGKESSRHLIILEIRL